MGAFNILSALTGAAQGFAMGGPGGAFAGGVSGGFAGGASPVSATGNAGNLMQSFDYSAILAQNQAMNMQQARFNLDMQRQSNAFNEMTSEQSELQRESNALREVAMEQRKADITITREFIKSIV